MDKGSRYIFFDKETYLDCHNGYDKPIISKNELRKKWKTRAMNGTRERNVINSLTRDNLRASYVEVGHGTYLMEHSQDEK